MPRKKRGCPGVGYKRTEKKQKQSHHDKRVSYLTPYTKRKQAEREALVVEESLRRDLAICHRLLSHYKMDELIWNHCSVRLPELGSAATDFLITPGNRHFAIMEPGDFLLGSSTELANVTANVIHGAVLSGRQDVNAVVHCHSDAVVFISNLTNSTEPLQYFTQDGGAFVDKVAYHDFEGVANDHSEQARIVADLGSDAHTLIMRNHGGLTTGKTIGQAFVRMFYLERVCQAQMDLMKAGQYIGPNAPNNLVKPLGKSILEKMAKTYEDPEFSHGVEWAGLKEFAEKRLGCTFGPEEDDEEE